MDGYPKYRLTKFKVWENIISVRSLAVQPSLAGQGLQLLPHLTPICATSIESIIAPIAHREFPVFCGSSKNFQMEL